MPEKRQEVTTEGGLDVAANRDAVQAAAAKVGETTAATQDLATQTTGLMEAGQQLGTALRPITQPVVRGVKTGTSKVYQKH